MEKKKTAKKKLPRGRVPASKGKVITPVKQKYIESPEALLACWEEYKAWVLSNPDVEEVVTPKGDVVQKYNQKPLLAQGFYAFMSRVYRASVHHYYIQAPGYEAYAPVISQIKSELYENQISGALTGKFKAPHLIARMNGIVEKTETQVTGAGGGPVKITLNLGGNK